MSARIVSLDAARRKRDEPWLSQREVAARVGRAARTVRRWHHLDPPVPHKRRYAAVLYQVSAVEAWMEMMGERRAG